MVDMGSIIKVSQYYTPSSIIIEQNYILNLFNLSIKGFYVFL